MDTVATGPAIASETGAEDGEGAAGEADTVGILPGSGSPEGDPTAPVTPPPVRTEPPVERQPVQEVARARPPSARTVTCNPCTQPDYPLTERRDRIEGQPVINVIFDQNGNVVRADLETSSGNAAFDQAALEEARRNWRFRDPYGLGGQVSVEGHVCHRRVRTARCRSICRSSGKPSNCLCSSRLPPMPPHR